MIHIYSGNGKGKTTAAVGLAVRAAGAGAKVRFYQFLKNGSSSEVKVLEEIDNISVYSAGCSKFTFRMNDDERAELKAVQDKLLAEALEAVVSGEADVLILDEFLDAYNGWLVDRRLARRIVEELPERAELVLTGRSPSAFFRSRADYHSVIRAVKHPYKRGIKARRGIEF